MKFNALIVVVSLLAVGGLVALPPVRESLGIGLDDAWQLALIHAEFALAPLLFLPLQGGRTKAAANASAALACWAAGTTVVLLFSFAAMLDAGLSTRLLSFAVWFASAGVLAAAARRDGWIFRGRVLLLCAFGLPPLWHYLALEYGGATATHLRPFSPNWQLAAQDIVFWPLLVTGGLAWAAAFAIPERRPQ